MEGGSEGKTCQESNFLQQPRNAEPGKRGGSSVTNDPCCQNQVWAIRARLELAGYLRDLALFNVAIDSKLRGCDLVRLAGPDPVKDDSVRERLSFIQSKTKRPVQFELTENTRETVLAWVKSPEMFACQFMFPSRFHDRPHISTRQYGRLVCDWVIAIGLEPSGYRASTGQHIPARRRHWSASKAAQAANKCLRSRQTPNSERP